MKKKLYGCKMSQILQADEIKCIGSTSFTEHLISYYNDIGTVGCTREADIKYSEQLGIIHRELLLLLKKWNLFVTWNIKNVAINFLINVLIARKVKPLKKYSSLFQVIFLSKLITLSAII